MQAVVWPAHAGLSAQQGFQPGQQPQVLPPVPVAKEHLRAAIAALRDMMRHTRHHHSCNPWHGATLFRLRSLRQRKSRYLSPKFLRESNPSGLACMLDAQPNGRRVHRFWQPGGGYDRNMRTTREIHEKLRYIHENPVRRGLVARPEDWPWSSAQAWATGTDEPLRIERESLPILALDRPWES